MERLVFLNSYFKPYDVDHRHLTCYISSSPIVSLHCEGPKNHGERRQRNFQRCLTAITLNCHLHLLERGLDVHSWIRGHNPSVRPKAHQIFKPTRVQGKAGNHWDNRSPTRWSKVASENERGRKSKQRYKAGEIRAAPVWGGEARGQGTQIRVNGNA